MSPLVIKLSLPVIAASLVCKLVTGEWALGGFACCIFLLHARRQGDNQNMPCAPFCYKSLYVHYHFMHAARRRGPPWSGAWDH